MTNYKHRNLNQSTEKLFIIKSRQTQKSFVVFTFNVKGIPIYDAFQESLPKPGETAVFCATSARGGEIKSSGRLF